MANLYGRMVDPYHGSRKVVTRTAARTIWTRLETWHGAVAVELDADGQYRVFVGSKYDPELKVLEGNVNNGSA